MLYALRAMDAIARNRSLGMSVGELAANLKISERRTRTLIRNMLKDSVVIELREVQGKRTYYRYMLSQEVIQWVKDLLVTQESMFEGIDNNAE